MASRLLLQSRALVARGPLAARVGRSRLHTSGIRAKFLDKLALFKRVGSEAEGYAEPRSQENVPIMERLGVMRRRGGYDQGAGMPLYVPVKAKNVEKAWTTWARHLRHPDPAVTPPTRETLVELLMLIVNAALPRTAGIMTEAIRSKQPVAGFRATVLLRHIFAQTSSSEASSELPGIDLRLGLTAQDYKHIIALMRLALDSGLPSGNTHAVGTLAIDDLELEFGDMEVSRLIQAVVQAAIQDGVQVDAGMLRAMLRAMVRTQDVAAARDTLAMCSSDLAQLLDPHAQCNSQATPNVLGTPQSELCRSAVEGMLQLVAVGSDPNILSADPRLPQEDLEYSQLESVVDYSDQRPSAAEIDTVRGWRTATGERIYRAFVAAGIRQVPAPDNGTRPALQGSVVPTPQMVASMLGIYISAGDAEHTALYYETLRAVLSEQPARATENGGNAAGCQELKSTHKMDADLWVDISQAACAADQPWLAAQILGGMAGDGWAPPQTVYERYLDAVSDPSDASLASALCELRDSMLANGVAAAELAVREPLICALTGQRDAVPQEFLASRVEQAIALAGLSDALSAETVQESSATEGGVPNETACSPGAENAVSDETVREILSAIVASGQITRAQDLADAWSSGRPDLVTQRFVAEVVRGMGRAGDHSQALELFSNYQHLNADESTLDMLCAVLEVYMRAGDYAEAISVGKRIRGLASEQQLPGRDTYNYLLSAYCQETQPAEAMCVLEEMRRYKVHADSDTYAVLALSMSTLRSLDGLRLVSALACVDYNMVTRGAKPGEYSRPLPLETDYYNGLIEAFGRTAEPMLALQVWEVMRFRGVRPNHVTATLLMDTCGWCERVHWDDDMRPQEVFANHEVPDDYVYTGAKLMYLHFLASALQQLQQAGL
ncbi:hypothetical protein GGF43_003756, partial [Coemansia sp. RSA 2618]